MKTYTLQKNIILISLLLMFVLGACGGRPKPVTNSVQLNQADVVNTETASVESNGEFQVIIIGGHDTDPQDNGRPVALIASMLGVSPEVFREAFSNVNPAGAGTGGPSEQQAQANKAALMNVLEPYGVTNDWLDEVSNYYRYNQSAGEVWTQTPAIVEAILTDGVVTGFEIIDAGSGYTSAPMITILNSEITATATLAFTTDFGTNGSIASININP